jgi:hypothetical protein
MSVSGVSATAPAPSVYRNQQSTPSKADTNGNNAAVTADTQNSAAADKGQTDAAQKATQIATERQASTRGDSQSIDKLA